MVEEQKLPDQSNSAEDCSSKTERAVRVLFVTADGDGSNRATALGNRRQFSVRTANADGYLGLGDIDCLVCEYRLSDGNGLDLLADVRYEYPTLPFILVSERRVEGLAEEALSAGAADYVHCPTDGSTALLAHRIRTAVDREDDEQGKEKGRTGEDEQHDELPRIYHALETAQEGISLLDADGRFIYVNDTYADLYGYASDEMLGMHWEAIYPDDEVGKVYDDILPGVDQGGSWSGETTGLRADGSTFIEDHSLSKTAGGGLVCTIRDITEEREREQLVERYRSVVEDVFGESEVGVFILDSSSEVTWSNQAVTDYFGLETIPTDGREMTELVDNHLKHRVAESEAFTEQIVDVYEGNSSDEEFEIHVLPSEGSGERYLQHRSQPIDSGKYAGGRLELYYDITQRKRRERELRRSKERLEVATNAGSLGIWTWDFETDTVTADEFLAETYGMDPAMAARGAPIDRFFGSVHEDDKDRVWRELHRAVEETDEFEVEYRVRDTADNQLWVVSRGEIEYDENGDPLRMNGAFTDVTERRQREQALSDTEERLEAAMTVGSVGTWDWNVAEDEVVTDAALADLFGIDPELAQDGIQLATFIESIHENDREEAEAAIERTLETGEELEIEYRVRNASGEVRWVMARGEVEYDADGTPVRFSGALSDVTERKKREEKLEQFANVLSHDLRNPLAIAQMYLGEARRNGDGESFDEIERAHTRMETMIGNLLSMARGTEDGDDDRTLVSLETVVERAWGQTDTVDASLQVENVGAAVLADEDRLQAVFENLFRNSIEHGGTDVSIRVGRLDDGFFIADSGPGIPAEKRGDVLEYGYSDGNGTGFGLGIVSEVIDAHDWNVSVTEAADGGARLEVCGVEFDEANER